MLSVRYDRVLSQGIRDCETLKNKKHINIGAEFFSSVINKNMAICLGIQPIKDSCDATVAEILENYMSEQTDLGYVNVYHSTIVEHAAKGVSREFNYD